ncbi:MAG: hypothetical protein IJ936_06865, partial [Peptococcaceae bacterium]|nr:hypothetical protein [Peptococcaceae bacterium]
HDVLCKIKVLRISLITRSEESYEILTACHLAGDEQALHVTYSLLDGSLLCVVLRSSLCKIQEIAALYPSLAEDGKQKVIQGLTTLQELKAVLGPCI